MNYSKIGIFSDKFSTAQGYSALLSSYSDTIYSFDLHNDDNEELFDIIIIDFSTKKYRPFINTLINKNADKSIIIAISPYNALQIHAFIEHHEHVELILTKPFSIKKVVEQVNELLGI